MTAFSHPSDLDLAALISSKICHDVIGPVGGIYNGLEILDENGDPQSKAYALDVIRNLTVQGSARVQFWRFAFGAAGSAGSQIDLATAEQVSRGFIGSGKHKLNWNAGNGHLPKDRAKLLLNLVASAVTALPKGGEIDVAPLGSPDNPTIALHCRGVSARPPLYLTDYVAGSPVPVDAMSVQAYYTWRLAGAAGLRITVAKDGPDVVLSARPVA
jgi:histidine phosphotransferase ChpT